MPIKLHHTKRSLLGALALVLCSASCGELDDVTTIKDLRVLAIQAEPAAFLVDLANPGAGPDKQAQLKALVVDPTGVNQEIVVSSALGCPNYLDTITAATGQNTRVCSPTPLPLPNPDLAAALSSTPLVPAGGSTVSPTMPDGFSFEPVFQYGLTAAQLGLFFGSPTTGDALVDNTLTNNRTFGLDAITSFVFTRGTQTAEAVKRVVYWPLLDPAIYPGQTPNANPVMTGMTFYRSRNEMTGYPEDPYPDPIPVLSVSQKDKLYVEPVGAKAEEYVFYEKDHEMGGAIVPRRTTELLRYGFFATSGTFSPAERRSKLSPIFTSKDGMVHLDSEYNLPKAKDVPVDGLDVTLWIVVHDERAGVSWLPGKIRVMP